MVLKRCISNVFVVFQRLMTSFVNRLFTVSSFESDFPLVLDVDGEIGKKIVMPEGIRYEKSQIKRFEFLLDGKKN